MMIKKKLTHKCKLLIKTIREGKTTASMIPSCSNANQYFDELVDDGYMRNEWGWFGDSWVKWRFIADMKKALEYLAKHGVDTKNL
jgi:hypothetical protein